MATNPEPLVVTHKKFSSIKSQESVQSTNSDQSYDPVEFNSSVDAEEEEEDDDEEEEEEEGDDGDEDETDSVTGSSGKNKSDTIPGKVDENLNRKGGLRVKEAGLNDLKDLNILKTIGKHFVVNLSCCHFLLTSKGTRFALFLIIFLH